jgi:hypothetical protein
MRYFYSVIIGILMAAMVALPAFAAPYSAPKVFSYRDPILSHDLNDINTAISASCGTASVTSAQLATGAAIANVGAGGVSAINLAYGDSTTWDTMPVKMYAGEYTGDSTLARRVSCGGIRPMFVEVNSYSVTTSVQWQYDVRWDTTQTLAVTPTTRRFITSALSVTKGDTQFTVTSNVETDTNVNYSGRVYLYRVWGY